MLEPDDYSGVDFGDTDLCVPPHNIRAEQSLIGGLMLDQDAWDKIADAVSADDFYRREHRRIFGVIADLANQDQPRDIVTVAERLERAGELESAGGLSYIGALANETPSAANVRTYASIVRQASVMRQTIAVCADISASAYNPEGKDPAEIINDAAARIGAIAEQGQRGKAPQSMRAVISGVIEYLTEMCERDGSLLGLSTGFADLDAQTAGLQGGDLIIVAGRPSMGKTTLAMNIAERAALDGKRVLVFSLEMPEKQIGLRSIASCARVNFGRLRNSNLDDNEWKRVTASGARLSASQMLIDDYSSLTTLDIATRARRLHRESKLDLIVIDYLQLISSHGKSENRTVEVAKQTRELKLLAKSLNVPVVVLSQLNRGLAARADKRPVMSDLRESGAIEQDADVILLLYRDEVYNESSPDKGTAEVIIGKQRNGPVGTVRLAFNGEQVRFDDLSPEWRRAEPEQMESPPKFGGRKGWEYQ